MIGSGLMLVNLPFGTGAPPEGGFTNNSNVVANLTTIAPVSVNEGKTYIGMVNVTIQNLGGINDTLEWINVAVKNYTDVSSVSLWNDTDGNGIFSTSGDTLMGVVSPSQLSGDLGYANFTQLDMGILNGTSMSIYFAYNISTTATHGDLINASILKNRIYMTSAGYGANVSLYPSHDTSIDNINVSVQITTVAPPVVKAGERNVGMLNVTFNNTGGAPDILLWINVTIKSYTDVASVAVWNETNGDGKFSAVSDTPMGTGNVYQLSGSLGYSNISGLNMGIMRYTSMSIYIVYNISSSPTHGNFINSSLLPYQIKLSLAGAKDTTAYYPDYDTEIDTVRPLIVSITTTDPNRDGRIENATIKFSEPILDSSIDVTRFYIGGVSASSFSTMATPDDEYIEISLAAGVAGTDAKEVTYSFLTDKTTDYAGNELDTVNPGDIYEKDGASPVVIKAITGDINKNGKIDRYVLTISENVTVYSGFFDSLNIAGYTVDKIKSYQSGPSEVIVSLLEGSDFDTDAVPDITYPGGNGLIVDSVPTAPIDVASGDLNNDSIPDIAILNSATKTISVFINDGTGDIGFSKSYPSGISRGNITIGDVNNDNLNDVVASDYINGEIKVFTQNMSTNWLNPYVNYTSGSGPLGIAIGDINDDERNDVVVANFDEDKIAVFIQNSGGTLNSPTKYNSGDGPVDVVIADISRTESYTEVLYDVVVVNMLDDTITPYRQSTSGTLTTMSSTSTPQGPYSITAADLNGDAWTDVAVACRDANSVAVILQVSSSWTNTYPDSVYTEIPVESVPENIAAIDADSDRDNDIIVTSKANNTVSFLLQSSGSYSLGWKKLLDSHPHGLAVDDFNLDGSFDAVTVQREKNSLTFLTQKLENYNYMTRHNEYFGYDKRANNPTAVDIGDINNDGQNDIVVADYYGSRISVKYGNPGGGFEDKVDYDLYRSGWWYPWDVKIGDLNNDSLNDVAFTIYNTNRMGVMYQGPNGVLNDPTWFATYTSSRRLAIGDINNDTLNDVVVTTSNWQGWISVFTQNPSNNQLNSKYDYMTGLRYPWGVTIGEVSGDHLPDVVITYDDYYNNLYHMARMKQKSDGYLDTPEKFQWSNDYYKSLYDVAVGDFNGDGRNDIVAPREDSQDDSFGVWYQTVSNSFGYATTYSTNDNYNSYDLAVGDMNGDGKDDVIVSFYGNDHVMVYCQDAGGFSLWGSYSVGRDPRGVAVGDLNNDNMPDIVTANYNSGTDSNGISILLRDKDRFTFNGARMDYSGDAPYQLAKGDLNSDGYTDIAVIAQGGSPYYMYVHYGDSTNTYSSTKAYSIPGYPYSVEIGDINDDGRDDVIVGDTSNRLVIFYQKYDGTLSSYTTISTYNDPFDIAIGDIDNDGRNDVVYSTYYYMVRHYQTTTGTLGSYNTWYTGNYYHYGIAVGDINNDSRNDIVMSLDGSDSLYYWLQTSSGSLSSPSSFSVGDQPKSVKIADINNDGLNDIINTNYGTNDGITVITQKSTGGFNSATSYYPTQDTNPWDLAVGDINGDGLNDVVTADISTNTLSIYLQNDTGGLDSRDIYSTYSNPRFIELVDLDGDGIQEILTTHPNEDFMATHFQTDMGSGSTVTNIKLGSNALQQIASGDVTEEDGADPVYAFAITGSKASGQSADYNKILVRASEDLNESSVNSDGSDFTVTGHTVSAAVESSPGHVLLTVTTLNSSETPVVSLTGSIIDATGLPVTTGSKTSKDGLRPRATAAKTADSDLDGYIDRYVISFDEDIYGTFNGTGFTVTGYTIDPVNSTRSASNEMTLALVEGSSYDTGLTPNIDYSPGDIQDSSHNYLANITDVVESDGAPPAYAVAYVYYIKETHPNLYAPDETTIFYNNIPAGLIAPFTIQVEATDNGNLDFARGEDAFGNTSVQDTTENTGGTAWEYELTYEVNQGETKNSSIKVWVYDIYGNNATDSISVVLDIAPPSTTLLTPLGTNYVPPFQAISLSASDIAGIYLTKYRIDNGPWQNYTGPIYLGSYGYGVHNVSYYSIDNVNNTETVQVGEIYVTRDWTDGGPGAGYYMNTVILGCNITIDGTLIFENVTLLMNNTAYDTQWINVTESGRLVVRNSTIIAVNSAYHHRFIVKGQLDLYQTNLGNLWADPSSKLGGLEIYNDSVRIEKGNFFDASGMAINVYSASPSIRNSTFRDSFGGIGVDGGAPVIYQNTITNVTVGMGITNNTGQMEISSNSIDSAFFGIYGMDLFKTDNNFRITNNDFSNINGYGIFIKDTRSATQQLLIDYNRFEKVKGGIRVENINTPDLYITDNTIKNLTGPNMGIATNNTGNVNIRRNNFVNAYGDAIQVRKNTGIAKIDNNTIAGGTGTQNTHTSISAYQNEGKIYILNNDIKNTKNVESIGTWYNENGTVIYVKDNHLINNKNGGIWFEEYSDRVYADNNVVESNAYGIRAKHIEQSLSDNLYIRNNRIMNNTKFGGWSAGISIDQINNLNIENNIIAKTEDAGIEIFDQVWGTLLVEDNTLEENGDEGLYLWDSDINLGNSIKNNSFISNDGGTFAIYCDFNPGTWDVYDSSEFVKNSLYFGGGAPDIIIHDGANWSFASTLLDWFGDITVQSGGTLYAYDTTFSGPSYYSFDVFGNLYLSSCVVEYADELLIQNPDSVYLVATRFQYCGSNGIHLKNANITLQNVKFEYNLGNGLYIENSNPTIRRCLFEYNDAHGIYGENFDGTITESEFWNNEKDNIRLKDSSGRIEKSILYYAYDNNIYLSYSDTVIEQCAIWDAIDYGIYLYHSNAHILKNNEIYRLSSNYGFGTWTCDIADSRQDNIYVYYSNPHIENNTIETSSKNGISMIYSGGHIEYNEIAWNTGSGIGKFNVKSPSIHDNYIHDNGDSPPNRAPSATGGTINPSNPIYSSTLSITPVGWYDPDGDPAGFQYQWQINVSGTWTNLAGATASTLSNRFVGGDEIRCRLTPWDGKTTGPAVNSSSVIIGNSPPRITSVGISPSPAYDNSVLSGVPTGFWDPDGDTTQVYYYQWYNQSGAISGATSSSLAPSKFKANDTIYCTVIPSDGKDNGTSVKSISVLIIHYTDPGQGVEDYDGDGVPDSQDAFPYDSKEWKDTDGDGKGDNSDPDIDGDGYNNTIDAFDYDKNEWKDTDSDGVGDNTDQDDDNDGYLDVRDAFPFNSTEWRDTDNDGIGDNTDDDIDGDGYNNTVDAFDYNSNEWKDTDGDGVGDNTDQDDDDDGYYDIIDAFPLDPTEQRDTDLDGIGDNADTDDDDDGYLDVWEKKLGTNSKNADSKPLDTDNDGKPDGDSTNSESWMDLDDDNDGYNDTVEISGGYDPKDPEDYPGRPNRAPSITKVSLSPSPAYDNSVLSAIPEGFSDPDGDTTQIYYYQWYNGSGAIPGATLSYLSPKYFGVNDTIYCIVIPSDGKDNGTGVKSVVVLILKYTSDDKPKDYDGDGYIDSQDAFPYDKNEWRDTDGDGKGDNSDPDIDGDGYLNANDLFDYDKTEWNDTDSDGIGDNSDGDIDGDGVLNSQDAFPYNKNEWKDTDGDGIGDNSDPDIDGDGVANAQDAFPKDKTETKDSDGDGIGDNIDQDDDNDGYYDVTDAFPHNPNEHADNDKDGIGDNADDDDDNDGFKDSWEAYLGTDNKTHSSQPRDTDGDKKPDGDATNSQPWMDTDDDNDGVSDAAEKSAGTDPLDPNDYPGAPNRAPSITKVSLSPTPAYDNSVITAIPESFSDPDGDTNQVFYYQWYVNGVKVPGQTQSYLSPTYFKANDTVYCIVTPSDGKDNGTAVKSVVALIIHYTEPGTEPKDFDGDGYPDDQDDFPYDKNEWHDTDRDGVGDNSDTDIDGDGYDNDVEEEAGSNPYNDNSVPGDIDGDDILDKDDNDIDGDNVNNSLDAFPRDRTETKDSDGDGIGDNADQDDDNDGVLDAQDEFPFDDSEWKDTDGDGIGDNADTDIDGDGVINTEDAYPKDKSESKDTDGDGIGDNADRDIDGDGIANDQDDFPTDPNEWRDTDGDGIGDNADNDRDGDGIENDKDMFPDSKDDWKDSDGDGLGDTIDPDDDNDGYPDVQDQFPNDPNEWKDSDGDGKGDNSDSDRDGDGRPNANDTFPDDGSEWDDYDGDGLGDNRDPDDDNDGFYDIIDSFPFDATQWKDFDGDGAGDNPNGNNPDTDIDGDGVSNEADAFPYNPNEYQDSDNDGVGDVMDQDDDNDGVPDVKDDFPYDPTKSEKTAATDKETSADETGPDMGFIALIIVMIVVLLVFLIIYLQMKKTMTAEESLKDNSTDGRFGRTPPDREPGPRGRRGGSDDRPNRNARDRKNDSQKKSIKKGRRQE